MTARTMAGIMLLPLLALVACAPWQTPAPVTPVSYQTARDTLQRTVGRLRRLVALQLRIVPARCSGGDEGPGHRVALDGSARELLARQKGYELIEPDGEHPLAGLGDPADDAAGAALAIDLLAAGDAPLPPAAAATLARLRDEARVDGVLVLRQELSCLKSSPATRGLMALFTFGVSEMLAMDMALPFEEYLAAVVVETATGRPVWRNVYGRLDQVVIQPPPVLNPADPAGDKHTWSVRHLLEPLEPAMPRLLTR